MLGDDLGSEKMIHLLTRLQFTNIPKLKYYGISPYMFGELIFYPPTKMVQMEIAK